MANAADKIEDAAGQPLHEVERIERNDRHQLLLYAKGNPEPFTDVHLARYFPWTDPDGYIAVRSLEGKELAIIRSLDDLDRESRQAAVDELASRVFNPRITKVLEHNREFGITTIVAETDRGPVSFQMQGRPNVRVLSTSRALFRDVDGNTYELPDLAQLDPLSRKLLHQYF